jgi:heme a synthase
VLATLRSWWRGGVSARRFLTLASLSLTAMFVVVTSGAFVRLTGSGLGCENWPRCGDTPYPQQGFHAFVEFGNRVVAAVGILFALVTWLASRRTAGLPRFARLAALGALLGGLAQIPLGGVTVILDLHPLAVMSHFLLALVVVALSVVVVTEAWSHERGLGTPVRPSWLRRAVVWAGLPLCAALVVTGAVATASGPHPGADEDVERLGIGITETVYWHVRVAAVFGICVLVLGLFLIRSRREAPGVFAVWCSLLAALVAQAIVGEVQYRNALPWGLVLVHVLLAATIWVLFVALSLALSRPPLPLVETRRVGAVPTAKPVQTPQSSDVTSGTSG